MTAQSTYLNLAPRALPVAAGDYVRGSRDMGETIARLALVARVQRWASLPAPVKAIRF